MLQDNSRNLRLRHIHSGSAGITDFRTNRTNTPGGTNTYAYDLQTFYYDIDIHTASNRGQADRVERYVEWNLINKPSWQRYVDASNLARRVTVIKGPAWNNLAVPQVDLVILLPGTGQDDLRALDWFFAQYGVNKVNLPPTHAFPIKFSSALADASRDLNIPATDVLVAAMNSGRSVENKGALQWSVFRTDASSNPEELFKPDFGDLMADVKRIISFKNDLKAQNSRIRNVYLFGFSAGASAVHNIACLFPDQFDGYGIIDITLNASMYTHCGAHQQGDRTAITRQLFDQVGIYPTSLAVNPRPIGFVADTHSPKASNDMGDATGGIAPHTIHCGAIGPLSGFLLDTAECQEDWYDKNYAGNGLDIIVKSTDPAITATNGDVLVQGQFDYQTTVERYLGLLGLNGAAYKSVRDPLPCNGANASVCTDFAQQPQFCRNNGVSGGGLTYFRDDLSQAHDPMLSGMWIWNQGGPHVLGYIEVYGGGHQVPGRGLDCTGPGGTHDFDTATQFLKFMSIYGNLVLR